MYEEIPGKAGAILRVASRCGVKITPMMHSDIVGWTIGTDPIDSLYVYWSPTRARSGRTTIYRVGRKLHTTVKMTGNEAQAWVCARRTRETAEG